MSSYSTKVTGAPGCWLITLEMKNTGSADATLIKVYVNDVSLPAANYASEAFVASQVTADMPAAGLTLASGASGTLEARIGAGYQQLERTDLLSIQIQME